MKVQIVLKSGASIEVDLEELQIGRSPLNGELTSLTWTCLLYTSPSPRD